MINSHCVKRFEGYLGRNLTHEELKIAEYICSYGFSELDISEAIAVFIFLCYVAAIEKELGRRLSPDEKKKAEKLFKQGISAKDAAIQIQPPPPPKPRTTSTPSP